MEFLIEGFMAVTWKELVMYAIGILLIWLAIKKDYEPRPASSHGFRRHSGKPSGNRRSEPGAERGW